MTKEKQPHAFRTLIFVAVTVPVITYLVQFAIKKNNESELRAQKCQQECSLQGYPGHEFKWSIFSGPECACLGERGRIE